MKWTVYLLIDPRYGDIRYVGASKVLERRRYQLWDSNRKKVAWLQELKDEGVKVAIVPLETCESQAEVTKAEMDWIRRFKLAGCSLFNTNHSYFDNTWNKRKKRHAKRAG